MTPSVQIAGGRRVTRWTREIIIEKIVEWNELHGEPPCSADWNPSLARWRAQEWRIERYRGGGWPSTNAVKRAFGGSFDAAVRAAGLVPARPGPRRAALTARPDVEQRAPLPPRDLEVELRDALQRARVAESRAADSEARARAAIDQERAIASRGLVSVPPRPPASGSNGLDHLAGPAILARAVHGVARAHASGSRRALDRALAEVAAAAERWRDRL